MIDVNRQKFWILSSAQQFDLMGQGNAVEWNDGLQVLRLRSSRTLTDMPADRMKARELADQMPVTLDALGTWARVNETGQVVLAGGVFPDPIEIFSLPVGERVVDMAMNPDGVLYLISKNGDGISTVYLINRRGSKETGKAGYLEADDGRYDMEVVKALFPEGTNQPDRLVALPEGGALLLDRENKVFWQVVGKVYRDQPTAMYPPKTPRPCTDGPSAQELIERPELILSEEYEAVAMAVSLKGEVAVLLFPEQKDKPAAVVLIVGEQVSGPVFLDSAQAPYSIGWVKDDQWAVLCADKKEAFVYPVPWSVATQTSPKTVSVSGRRYPLNWGAGDGQKNVKFCNGLSHPLYYPSSDRQGDFLLRPLYPLSFPAYASQAVVKTATIIDSGEPNAVWHRLYLEAHLPKDTGVIVHLAAGEDKDTLTNEPEWAPHHFGAIPATSSGSEVPRGVWLNDTSEVPFFPGLLHCRPEADTAGLFGVLIQRAGYVVRQVRGRYLNVQIELIGGGRASPEIAALRLYHPRFSYLDHYLPELYRETNVRQKAGETGPASGPDFLQRLLCLFESVLTPLEDKVAAVHMLTNPMSAPAEALDWLGQWVGLGEGVELNEKQKRLSIKNATELYRKRGTMQGLKLALNLLTDNMVSRGDIVLLEDFRLRRTFATILGADLSVENDPLLMGDIPNANSFVGDTLFLGEEEKKEFMALYSAEVVLSSDEQESVDIFYARLSNRLTVLVHRHTDNETLGLISRVVTMETPAHIEFRVVPVSKPLLVGMYALLGVDTYLQQEPERHTARVGHSYLGRYDFIRKLPVLDDRLEP